MSTPEFQVGIDLQLMIAHPRGPGEPEPKRNHVSRIRWLFSSRHNPDSDLQPPTAGGRSEARVLSAGAPDSRGDKKWPSRNLILPTHDDQFGFPAKRCVWKVCDILATSGFPVACYYPSNPRRGDPVTVGMDKSNTTVVTGENGSQFRTWNGSAAFNTVSPQDQYWFITHEMGVTQRVRRELAGEAPMGYKWYCIGIKSPMISDQCELNLRDTQGSRRLPSLGAVIHVLRSELKVWTNRLCGLSLRLVAVDGEFTAINVKKAAALVSLLEAPLLSKFYEPKRLTDSEVSFISTDSRIAGGEWGHSREDDSSRNIVRNFITNRNDRRRYYREGPDALHLLLYRILTQIDLHALHDGLLADPSSPCSFNIGDGVVEFSYAEASLETEYIAIWVDIARKIMENAVKGDDECGRLLAGLYDLRTGGRQMGWISYWNLLGVGEHEGDNWMAWVKSVANGYRGGERVHAKVSL